MRIEEVAIYTAEITLGQFLKWSHVAASGAEAKRLVENGQVSVNNRVETRRGHCLIPGDLVCVAGRMLRVTYPQ